MQQKMPKQETMTQAHIRKAQGAFLLAHRMGLIEDPSMEAWRPDVRSTTKSCGEWNRKDSASMDRIIFRTGVSAI